MSYRRRASPLHAARAGAGCAYCLAFAAAALILSNPVALGALALALIGAGAGAGLGRELRRAALLALPLAVTIALINALVTRDGLTVIARLGNLPLLGHTDITLEASAYGGILGLKAFVLILSGALYTAGVDPDEVLRLLRRVSFHSALTATLATRMVPVLLRDSRRLADAQRCRPGPRPSRPALMRATTAGVLDRALDVAAALEVRGYGAARRPPRRRRPWSRHDLGFAAAALGIVAVAIALRVGGARAVRRLSVAARGGAAGRRGRVRGARRGGAGAVRGPQGGRDVDAVIDVRELTYSYAGGESPALDGVSLEVGAGELVVVAGASGSGKSTLLRAISGLVPHFHGGEFGGPGARRRDGHPRARSGRAGRRRGHAVPGPRDPGRDGDPAR